MIDLVSKLPHVGTTIFTIIGKLAMEHDAINLSQGFPNFGTDPELLRLVQEAIASGHNQYAPMQGIYSLRERIAEKIDTLYEHYYHPESEITITASATQGIFTAISAFVNAHDEVIVFKPAYDCYEPAIELCGGVVKPLQLKHGTFEVDWAEFKKAITTKTRMVIINTPHNPTGTILSEKDMLQLQVHLKDTDIIVVSDEVYEHLVFDGASHQSAAKFEDLASRSILCASFGKTFHVTGWKMGYCAAPKALMREFRKVHQYVVFCVNHPIQRGLAQYLKTPENYLGLNNFYQQKRDYFLRGIQSSRFKFKPALGTYFQLLDYSKITDEKDIDFSKRLIQEHRIASIPISVFNVNNEDYRQLRFCFAKTTETLDKAIEILNRF
ncbi:MAG: methionine aminotransferase [Croceivirga sp.]